MNEIGNKFLVAGDKCMLQMPLRQPGFTYSPSRPLKKNKETIQFFFTKSCPSVSLSYTHFMITIIYYYQLYFVQFTP